MIVLLEVLYAPALMKLMSGVDCGVGSTTALVGARPI